MANQVLSPDQLSIFETLFQQIFILILVATLPMIQHVTFVIQYTCQVEIRQNKLYFFSMRSFGPLELNNRQLLLYLFFFYPACMFTTWVKRITKYAHIDGDKSLLSPSVIYMFHVLKKSHNG